MIIYPHFPPSNLAGVHRPRLFAQHLGSYGWTPVILTVDERFYEELPDWNLVKLISPDLRIEKVNALPLLKSRLVGDIGLRAFLSLYNRAKRLIQSERFDFVYIPIPSFYCALLGRMLHRSTGVGYGIDYIDPWVHEFPGSKKKFSRAWLSTRVARLLEPIAVKKAVLITGVAEGYYKPVINRNPHLSTQAVSGAMPYGGEVKDHEIIPMLNIHPYLFNRNDKKFQFVYAGAMLPKAYKPLDAIFRSISAKSEEFKNVEFHFIGTGSRPDDPESFNIKPLAVAHGLWNTVIFEYPRRIPYLDVLVHLDAADAVFILGSTEPHYTPSKTYQAVLSKKPLMAVLHDQSTAVEIIRASGAGLVLSFEGEIGVSEIESGFSRFYASFSNFAHTFSPASVNMQLFEKFSAANVTRALAKLLDEAINK